MEISLNVYINDFETNIQFDDSIIEILNANNFKISKSTLYFLLKDNVVSYIGQGKNNFSQEDQKFDKVIKVEVPSYVDLEYLEYIFIEEAIQKKIELINKQKSSEPKIWKSQKSDVDAYKDKVLFILKNFELDIFKSQNNTKSSSKENFSKPRHKWTKEISQILFTAKSIGGEGKAIWRSKDELVLLSGAKLTVNPQMNKDGSMNYSAQFAQKLRTDHLDKIVDNYTTVDIVFKSPNQLGMFLFFGGQNTWAELKDSNGKSLDDWSRID
ncbi:MAG: hypothetical protein K0R72_668 [Clostridia bacterium]|jgi:hypothetical protein|nr:hypothetical protein [Clostridia bacterium]